MNKTYQHIPIKNNDGNIFPVLDELPQVLRACGFKQLTNEAAAELREKSVVMLFNISKNTISTYVIHKVIPNTRLDFTHDRPISADAEMHGYEAKLPSASFHNYLYKVIAEKPIHNSADAGNAGFRPLSEVHSGEMRPGNVVLLRVKRTEYITLAIVRVLKMCNGDQRLLYWTQCPHVVGEWISKAFIGNFDRYEYLVLGG